MNAVRTKNAESAFLVTAEIDKAAMPFAGAGKRHLMDRPGVCRTLVFK
jgi:hypothetical protein